ncbi:MAG: DUF4153 domain-containing protein [Bacillota bacterium]|nr:DUF4153 domain-containing protein [Bacillota bacterium]
MKVTGFIKNKFANIFNAFRRFPATCASVVITYVMMVLIFEKVFAEKHFIFYLAMFTGILVCLLLELTMRIFATHLPIMTALLGVAAYGGLSILFWNNTNDDLGIPLGAFFGMLALLILYIPSVKGRFDFEKNAYIYFKNAFMTALFAVVLFGGVSLIFGAVNLLLVKVSYRVYTHIAFVAFVLFAPIFFVGNLPKYEEDMTLDDDSHKPPFFQILITYVVIPLYFIFTAVLYIYFVKILINLKWPIGEVGPLVLAYGIIGILTFVLCDGGYNRLSAVFRRIFPFIVIVPVLTQLAAVVIRLRAYGFTESRYYLLAFSVVLIATIVILTITNGKGIRFTALAAAIICFISILPAVGALDISAHDQIVRLNYYLNKNNMIKDGKITPKTDVSSDDKKEIRSITQYLTVTRHLTPKLKYLPVSFRFYQDFNDTFGFEANAYDTAKEHYFSIDRPFSIDVAGFSNFSMINKNENIGFNIKFTKKDKTITISLLNGSDTLATADATAFFDKLSSKDTGKNSVSADELTILLKGNKDYKLVFEYLSFSEENEIYDYNCYVLE